MVPVWQPRSFLSDSASISATVYGTPPTPSDSVAPLGISSTTSFAMAISVSLGAR